MQGLLFLREKARKEKESCYHLLFSHPREKQKKADQEKKKADQEKKKAKKVMDIKKVENPYNS